MLPLSEEILDDMAMNVGETEVAALVSISKFSMVNPKQMQDRGIQVMNMHGILGPMMLIWLNDISITVG